MEKSISFTSYKAMVEKINAFKALNGRLPNYVDHEGLRVYKADYQDAAARVVAFMDLHGRYPETVRIVGVLLINKTPLWLNLQKALKREFNDEKEMAVAFQNYPDYELYYNDEKTQEETLAALQAIGKPGVNCVDISQVVRQVLIDMGKTNVHIWRGKFKCGGHIWVTYGPNNTVFDAAGMMKWKYPIGQYMCSGTPTELRKDPAWLLSDDGRT